MKMKLSEKKPDLTSKTRFFLLCTTDIHLIVSVSLPFSFSILLFFTLVIMINIVIVISATPPALYIKMGQHNPKTYHQNGQICGHLCPHVDPAGFPGLFAESVSKKPVEKKA